MTMRWQIPQSDNTDAIIPPRQRRIAARITSWIWETFVGGYDRADDNPGGGHWYRVSFLAHVPADRELLNPNPIRQVAAGSHLGHIYGFDFMGDFQVERTLPEVEKERAERATRRHPPAPARFAGPPRCPCGKPASHLALDADDPGSACLPSLDDNGQVAYKQLRGRFTTPPPPPLPTSGEPLHPTPERLHVMTTITAPRRDTIDLHALHLRQEQELLSKLAADLLMRPCSTGWRTNDGTPGTADVAVIRRPTTTRIILTWTVDGQGDQRRARQLPNDLLDDNPTMRTFALTEAVATMARVLR